jgi:hypothetical protein
MVELFKQTSSLIIIRLLLLLYVAKGSSSLNLREKRTILNRISQPCKGKPNSHAWNIQWSFQSKRLPFIPTCGSGSPQATVGQYAHPICRTYACSATTWPYSYPRCETYSYSVRDCRTYSHSVAERIPAHRCVCEKPNYEWWGGMSTLRADRLLGLPLTIFHGMWLVLSNA